MTRAGMIIACLMACGPAAAQEDVVRPKMPGEVPVVPELIGPDIPRVSSDAWITTFKAQVQACWNVGALEEPVAVTVGFEMDEKGRPLPDTVVWKDAPQTADEPGQMAFKAARRAIILCGKDGYKVPLDQYARWRVVEMTFDPEGMVTR